MLFFDVRVFNPFVQSYCNPSLAITMFYQQHELEKKRRYEERVKETEHISFSPLVFSTLRGMGTTATKGYKRIASMIAEKREKSYSKVIIHWIYCRLSYSLLRSVVTLYVHLWILLYLSQPSWPSRYRHHGPCLC